MASNLRITGPRIREKRPCDHACYKDGMKLVYVWPTVETKEDGTVIKKNLSIVEMAEVVDIKAMTIYTRMDRYGHDHPDVFSRDSLRGGNGQNYGALPAGKAAVKLEKMGVGTWEAANL